MIVVARFSFPHEAYLAKANLESAGIDSFIADEHTVNTQWLYSHAMGGVRLMVEESNLAEAKEILTSDFSESLENHTKEDGRETRLPALIVEATTYQLIRKVNVRLFWYLSCSVFPLFFYKQGYKCNQCGKFSETL